MRAEEFITEAESYQPPELTVGDKILKGKFKNSPAEIKGFAKDKHNQPVLKTNKGEVQLFKPRISKLMKESTKVEFDGVTMTYDINTRINQLSLTAHNDDGEELGHVFFKIWEGNRLSPLELEVYAKYRSQGIAKAMYDFIKSQGYTVRRSAHQTDDGAGFWDKHRGENTVWEESEELTELFDPKTSFPLRWDSQADYHGGVHAEAYDADGRTIDISFTPSGNDEVIEIVFSRGGYYDMSGKGDAARVMATVINAINIYLQKYKPPYVAFSAKSTGGRASAYAAMIKRLVRGYTLLQPDQYPAVLNNFLEFIGNDATFVLARQ